MFIYRDDENELGRRAVTPDDMHIVDNTPLKRAKEMYQHCIQKARSKHSSSTSRSSALNRSDMSFNTQTYPSLPPSLPTSGSVPESE